MNLADPKFYEPEDIDVLLGVEMFYDILCGDKMSIPGHKAQLQETK